MGFAIAITDEHGVRHEYRVPECGEITVAEWARLCIPIHDLTGKNALHEDLKRLTGVPLKHLRRLSVGEMDRLIDAYVGLRRGMQEREAEVDATDYTNPEEIEHNGVTYAVPKNLEMETTYGQWEDMDSLIDGVKTEPEMMQAICAVLLIEKGKEYEGYHKQLDAFATLPARVAMGLTAFFLSRSERVRSVTARCTRRLVMSLLQGQGQEQASSIASTETGTD